MFFSRDVTISPLNVTDEHLTQWRNTSGISSILNYTFFTKKNPQNVSGSLEQNKISYILKNKATISPNKENVCAIAKIKYINGSHL
jgi:hypothetical protein